jgi:hypothetical protein
VSGNGRKPGDESLDTGGEAGTRKDGFWREEGGAAPSELAHEAGGAYATMVTSATEELHNLPDLPPSAWLRIDAEVRATSPEPTAYRLELPMVLGVVFSLFAGVLWFASTAQTEEEFAGFTTVQRWQDISDDAKTRKKAGLGEDDGARLANTVPQYADVIVAGEYARIVEAFDRHAFALAPSTRLRVLTWRPEHIAVVLEEGQVTCTVDALKPGERFEVQTELATVHVVGTVFTVLKLKGGGTEVLVSEGEVALLDLRYSGPVLSLPAGTVRRILPVSGVDHVDNARPGKIVPPLKVPTAAEKGSAKDKSGFRLIEIDVPDQNAPPSK